MMSISLLLFIVIFLGVGLISALALLLYVNDLAKKKQADAERAAAANDSGLPPDSPRS